MAVIAKEDIVDTNGAGDAFVGGFLSEFLKGTALDVRDHCSRVDLFYFAIYFILVPFLFFIFKQIHINLHNNTRCICVLV